MQNDAYDRLVQMIYAGACDDHAFLHALELLAAQYQCASAAFVYTDRDLPNTDIILTFGPFSRPEVRTRYLLEFADLDPAPRAMAGMPIGKASATDRLFTAEYMASSRFVNEFYRPLGLEEALGGPVIDADGRTGLVAIHRGRDRGSFTDEDIESFGRFLPHFGQALRLRRVFFDATGGKQALAEALEPLSQAVIVLDSHAAVEYANSKARALFARNDGLILRRTGHLELSDKSANNHLRGALASLRAPIVLKALRSRVLFPYAVRVCPRSGFGPAASRTGATLYIFDPDHRPHDPSQTLSLVLGLSQQASALVSTLLSGGDLAAYAASAGVSRNTAKFHLNAAFAATGTARQADLVQVVTGLLRDLGAGDRLMIASEAPRKLISHETATAQSDPARNGA